MIKIDKTEKATRKTPSAAEKSGKNGRCGATSMSQGGQKPQRWSSRPSLVKTEMKTTWRHLLAARWVTNPTYRRLLAPLPPCSNREICISDIPGAFAVCQGVEPTRARIDRISSPKVELSP